MKYENNLNGSKTNEELFSGYEYVANQNMAKAAIQVSALAHDE